MNPIPILLFLAFFGIWRGPYAPAKPPRQAEE